MLLGAVGGAESRAGVPGGVGAGCFSPPLLRQLVNALQQTLTSNPNNSALLRLTEALLKGQWSLVVCCFPVLEPVGLSGAHIESKPLLQAGLALLDHGVCVLL